MRLIEWSDEALKDAGRITDFLTDKNPDAAYRVLEKFQRAAEIVARSPGTARIGRVKGTFEKSVTGTSYIMALSFEIDRQDQDAVIILHIIHSSRNWKQGKWPKR